VAAARKALETGNMDRTLRWVSRKGDGESKRAFSEVLAAKPFDVSDVHASEEFVHAQLGFVLWAHGLYSYATGSGQGEDGTGGHGH